MRRTTAVVVVVVAVVVVAVVVSLGVSGSSTPGSGGGADGTQATWAEPVGSPPNYIFPFTDQEHYSVSTVQQFQYLMYRPLYWFEGGAAPRLDSALSLAQPPVYGTGAGGTTTVTVTLKPYRWSNGEQVTATDVKFWMNLLHAEKAHWAAYQPGGDGLPDNVANVVVDSATQLTVDLTGHVTPAWFTDSQLSQITPLPLAWDRTHASGAPGSGGCAAGLYGTVDNQCAAVYQFLSGQAGSGSPDAAARAKVLDGYAADPLWQVVDGPWRLRSFRATGDATLVPNRAYSGPDKPALSRLVERSFPSTRAELAALRDGQVSVGYLPAADVPGATSSPTAPGPNAGGLGSYSLTPVYAWAVNDIPYNFRSTGDGGNAGAILSQLYVRQALQSLVDQPSLVTGPRHGYAVPTYGPVPLTPGSTMATAAVRANPYRYDPAKARSLLASHGWQVAPGGVSTCRSPGTGPGHCGAGIAGGARMALTVDYVPGAGVDATLAQERSDFQAAGVSLTLHPGSYGAVTAAAVPCPSGCPWELAAWGTGWLFAPGHYPSGEQLFLTGAPWNAGSYSNATNDANIRATLAGGGSGALATYQDYLARQLPVLFQPSPAMTLLEVRHGLEGVTPASPYGQITPETWHWQH